MRTDVRSPLGAILFLLATGHLLAGDRTNVQGVGMARTGAAVARGIDAVGVNPANLGFAGSGTVTISILPLGIRVGNDVVDYSFYSRYLAGVETDSGRMGVLLTTADKEAILSRFAGGVGHGLVDAEARLLGIGIEAGTAGNFAVTVTDRVSGTLSLPAEYLRFLFYGNPPGSTYDFSGSHLEMAWMREYALSYARPLPGLLPLRSLYAGVSLKLVHGLSYLAVDRFDARLATSSVGVLDGTIDVLIRRGGIDPTAEEDSFELFPAPAGTGVGLDLGISGEVNDFLRVSASVTDIGAVTWRRNLTENRANNRIHLSDITNQGEKDSLDDALKGEEKPGTEFRSGLPATFRLGAALELHRLPGLKPFFAGEMTLAADYAQGLVDLPGTSTIPRGSVGIEYRPWRFLPLRAGISVGGADGFVAAFGIGFHAGVVDLDLATESLGWLLTPESSGTGAVAAGLRVRL